MPLLINISHRAEDLQFGEKVANLLQISSVNPLNLIQLRKYLSAFSEAFIFWDVDHPSSTISGDPFSIQNIITLLQKYSKPERVFILSDTPLHTRPYLLMVPFFNFHIRRRFEDPAAHLISLTIQAARGLLPLISKSFLAEPSNPRIRHQELILTNSSQKEAALDKIHSSFVELNIPSRLETILIQATDELLMNAIFDAPKKFGKFYRKMLPRNEKFKLNIQEQIKFEFGYSDSYFCIFVTDQFGSITKMDLLNSVRKNFSFKTYDIPKDSSNAGLGIYGILKEGLSIVYFCNPDQTTFAILLAPLAKNMRSFRKSFQFWGMK